MSELRPVYRRHLAHCVGSSEQCIGYSVGTVVALSSTGGTLRVAGYKRGFSLVKGVSVKKELLSNCSVK